MLKVPFNRFKHERILREKKRRLGVDTEQQEHVDSVHTLLSFERLKGHDEVLDLGHHRVYLGTLYECDVLV